MVSAQRYIVVEGLPGAGKTGLAKVLVEALSARFVEDPAGKNPFFDAYQKDPAGAAFSLQVFSFLSRFRQQQELAQGELFGGGIVSDYLFDRDRIYANLTLGEAEMSLYSQLLRMMAREALPIPDLVVYLQASTEVLRQRQQQVSHRPGLDGEALAALGQAYNHFFFHYNASSLLVVNTNDLDLRTGGRDLDDLVDRVLQTQVGTQYYTPKK